MKPWIIIIASAALFSLTRLPAVYAEQGITDYLDRKKDEIRSSVTPEAALRVGRNRVDLSLSPSVRLPGATQGRSVGISAQADLRMICGQYDLKATFQHLLGKEAREEFLDGLINMLVGELAGSGMDLLCQAEPTLCNLIQNYSISANLKMGYYKDLCQAIESAITDAQRKNYASAVEACLKEKQSQGVSLDRAMEACQKENPQVRGFRGEVLGQLDLGAALHDILGGSGLSPGAEKLLGRLSESTRVGPGLLSSEVDPHAIAGLHGEIREEYAGRLRALIEGALRRGPVLPQDLAQAAPAGMPPILEDEVRTWALLPASEREDMIGSLSSAYAMVELRRRIHEVERGIEALRGAPTVDEGKRRMLEDRLERLRNERRRLEEVHDDQVRAMDALARAKGLGGREYAKRIAQVRSRTDLGGKTNALANSVRPWGSCPAVAAPPVEGRSGGSLPGAGGTSGSRFEYGFGPSGATR